MSLSDYTVLKPILETDRLVLRLMNIDDAEDLREWTPNKAMYKYWGKNLGKCDKNPELLFSVPEKQTKSFHWGIVHKLENKVIGEIWVYLIENNRMAKVAFRISDKYQGNGYATEALSETVKFCFKKTELKRLWSDVDIRNIPSCHVMEKCGFVQEGKIRQGKMVSTWCDYYLYGMLKQDIFINKHES